jgi:hypothetical protein
MYRVSELGIHPNAMSKLKFNNLDSHKWLIDLL